MSDLSGIPYFPLELDKAGKVIDVAQVDAFSSQVAGATSTDLIVISHGWNNDIAEAEVLYRDLFANVAAALGDIGAGKDLAVLGVLWPSKKFAEATLIPGHGAAAASFSQAGPDETQLARRLDDLAGTLDRPDPMRAEAAKMCIGKLEDSPKARREFVDQIKLMLPRSSSDPHDDASDRFLAKDGDALLTALQTPVSAAPLRSWHQGAASTSIADSGAAAGLGDVLIGMRAAAWRLLNYATFYQMKERAGVVGSSLNAVLDELRQRSPRLRLHLVGHSFGARVVAATTDGTAPLSPSSLTLLQGAFSHNGFARLFNGSNDGFFRRVIAEAKVNGPVLVTHTANDEAIGSAYPLASRISGDNRLALGDENDPFGGLGRNGAIKLAPTEAIKGTLLDAGGRYAFQPGRVHNLLADDFIKSHSDVTGREVANALAQAVCMRVSGL